MSQLPQPAEIIPLGTRAGVFYGVALTSRPWDLPIDALVISVGAGLGALGSAAMKEFPDADWKAIPFHLIRPDAPALLDLDGHTGDRRLRLAVLASPHEGGTGSPTVGAIASATKASITTAADAGVVAIALPLLATGRLGGPVRDSGGAMITTAVETLAPDSARRIETVLFFAMAASDVEIVRQVWTAVMPPEAPATTPPPTAPREPVYSTVHLAGGYTKDVVDPNEYIPLDKDRLGVTPYVSMLATVIAAKDTPLPLSVGVFGEWGSGKSTFMGMLRGQVNELEGSPGYCGKIAQIGFNAWHYADANLWASLGDEIFRQLAEPERRPHEPDHEHEARLREGEKLREKLAAGLEQRKQLTAVTERAEAEAAALKHKIGVAESQRKTKAKDIIAALGQSKTFRTQVSGLWRRLGVGDEAEQGRLLAEQLRGTSDEADELRRMSRYRKGKLSLAVAGIVLVAGVCASAFVPQVKEWLAGVGIAFGGFAATGIALLGAARAGLRKLHTLAEELRCGLGDVAKKELVALRKAEADQRVAEAQLEEVVARIGELGRQLAELTPGKRLYAFLAERSEAEDYRGHLGLISTIRKDFQKLVALMTAKPKPGEARPMDRIVLYIDDLDRCSPQQVVDVLQAVHLLLAFDLFVVVVGVDPRWLLRSLSAHYDKLIDDDSERARDRWQVTPEDYLEKILNIPLVLPGMPDGSLERMLRAMVGAPEQEPPPPSVPASASDTGTVTDGVPQPVVGSPHTPLDVPDLIPVEAGSQVAAQLDPDRPPEIPQPLTEPEITLLASLHRLIDTPRDATRLINLYRMLRSTRDLSDASIFLAGEYQAVIVLLGIFTTRARLLGRFVDALLGRPSTTSWTDFLDDLKPVHLPKGWESDVGVILDADVPHWQHLHWNLVEISKAVTLEDVSAFQLWVPRIRRFSYVLSPVR